MSFPRKICEKSAKSLRQGETHDFVYCTFINLMKEPNSETFIFWVPALNHFMF